MKGFQRKEPLFSLCGLNCGLCTMHLGGYCPGCGGGPGNQSCPRARCSLAHGGVSFCWQCSEYPCSLYDGFDEFDSFLPHRNRTFDIAQAQAMGLDAYFAQLGEKRAALEELLACYNDGRRKTFFSAAISLLPYDTVRAVMDALHSRTELADRPIGERARTAAALFQAAADQQGICLKLRRKPKRR